MACLKHRFRIIFILLAVSFFFSSYAESVSSVAEKDSAAQGYEAYRAGDWNTAVFLLRKAVSLNSNPASDTLYMLIMAEMHNQDYTGALADTDVFLTLQERTEIANSVKLKADEAVLYISVHVNASLDQKAHGYEVWYLSPGYRRTVIDSKDADNDPKLFPILNSMMEEEYTTESILIAKFIMDGLQSQVGDLTLARGIKAEEWFVVRNSNMPSVLVELGFLTNYKEACLLNDKSYLQKTALGIYNGITAFVTHFERSKGFTGAK